MKSKNLKIAAITSLVIFNLAICFAATFAWFITAKNLKGSDIAVQIEAHELSLNYQILKFNETDKQIEETPTFHLNTYDSIIKEKNINNAIVIKTSLTGSALAGKAAIDVNINMVCSSSTYYTPELSNIIHFNFKAIDINYTDLSDIYYAASNELKSETMNTFFTTVKLTEVTLTQYQVPVVNNTATIYGIFDYDEDLIDDFIAVNHITLDDIPDFTNDLQYIRFSVHE